MAHQWSLLQSRHGESSSGCASVLNVTCSGGLKSVWVRPLPCNPTYVGDAERGERNVSLDGILRLANALGVRPGVLLHGLEGRVKPPR